MAAPAVSEFMKMELMAMMENGMSMKDMVKEIKKALKVKPRSAKRERLQADLDTALERLGKISLKAFRAEATKAWYRANPDAQAPVPAPNPRKNAFLEFARDNMAQTREENPALSYTDCLRKLSEKWHAQKKRKTRSNSHA